MDEVSSIRARHKSSRPKMENPAWMNAHADMDRLFIAYDALAAELAEIRGRPLNRYVHHQGMRIASLEAALREMIRVQQQGDGQGWGKTMADMARSALETPDE